MFCALKLSKKSEFFFSCRVSHSTSALVGNPFVHFEGNFTEIIHVYGEAISLSTASKLLFVTLEGAFEANRVCSASHSLGRTLQKVILYTNFHHIIVRLLFLYFVSVSFLEFY